MQKEVNTAEEQILAIDPYPRPGDKIIGELQLSQYKDVYRIRILKGKYRYIYRVEGNTVYAWYVEIRGQNTYKGRLPKRAVQKKDTRLYRNNEW